MYVNDLNYFVSNSSLRPYADDTKEYPSDVSPMVFQYVMNYVFSVLSVLFGMNMNLILMMRTLRRKVNLRC